MLRTSLLAITLVACAAPPPPQCPAAPPAAAPPPRPPTSAPIPEPPVVALVRALHGPNARATYDTFGERFRTAVPFDTIADLNAKSDKVAGRLLDVRLVYTEQDAQGTHATVVTIRERGAEAFNVWLDDKGILVGLFKNDVVEREAEEGPGPSDDYVAKRAYRLPAQGKWYVAHGGRSGKQNHHVGNAQQWYAFDLSVRDEAGKEARGDGKKNEDYFAFGRPVLAPAAGKIVLVVDAVEDYPPGQRERYFVPGNTVVIDHGDDEFSVLAHFKKGSIVVRPGQTVTVGQKLGLVGNTGNSSDPHIHWHLATQGGLSRGKALPIRFAPLYVNGKQLEGASPVRGDVIENAP